MYRACYEGSELEIYSTPEFRKFAEDHSIKLRQIIWQDVTTYARYLFLEYDVQPVKTAMGIYNSIIWLPSIRGDERFYQPDSVTRKALYEGRTIVLNHISKYLSIEELEGHKRTTNPPELECKIGDENFPLMIENDVTDIAQIFEDGIGYSREKVFTQLLDIALRLMTKTFDDTPHPLNETELKDIFHMGYLMIQDRIKSVRKYPEEARALERSRLTELDLRDTKLFRMDIDMSD